MSGRQNLYRMQYWQLAERQRYLVDLEALAARLRADIDDLTRDIDAAGNAKTGSDRRIGFPLFVGPLLERRDKLVGTVAEIDARIDEARQAVAAAQQEV
jgi:hypothetical protein